jgi:hypothetical protein
MAAQGFLNERGKPFNPKSRRHAGRPTGRDPEFSKNTALKKCDGRHSGVPSVVLALY